MGRVIATKNSESFCIELYRREYNNYNIEKQLGYYCLQHLYFYLTLTGCVIKAIYMYAQVEDITGLEVPHELHVKRSHSTRNETYAVVNQADVVINGAL